MLWSVLVMTSLQEQPVGIRLPPGAHSYHAPPAAADHEAVVLSTTIGRPEERRQAILRSGSSLREQDGIGGDASVVHSDFAAGVRIGYSRIAGAYDRVSIRRHSRTDLYNLYQRRATRRRERVLGEECQIWSTTRIGGNSGVELDLQSCDTADGIQLWSRAVGSRGTIIAESRTTSFRRRPVSPGEIRPPADLLRWAHWRDLPVRGATASWPTGRARNYELRLEGTRGGERQRVLRSRGDWTYTDRILGDGGRYLRIDNRIIGINYQADADGRPVSLDISRLPQGQVEADDSQTHLPTEPAATERVLGETCFWSRQGTAQGVVVTSGEHRSCVTADGLPLKIYSHHRVLSADVTATHLTRRPPPLSALMPPAEAFDWRRWGVRPYH